MKMHQQEMHIMSPNENGANKHRFKKNNIPVNTSA